VTESGDFTPACPVPLNPMDTIRMAHGGGGKLMHDLIEKLIVPAFNNDALKTRHDSAVLDIGGRRVAFTTDSYVVRPLFFPGGDIGSLAINGTVNDLAMSGAVPVAVSAAFIIEEGFSQESLRRVVDSMKRAADEAGVSIVTGDTKVVDRGKGDGIFINTAGIGLLDQGIDIRPSNVANGDAVLLSGDLGRHGVAIMASREGLEFESTIESDCAPLHGLVQRLLKGGVRVHMLRDLTRGGLASALVEIAEASRLNIHIEGSAIPVSDSVRGACEILGLDPLYVANEGRLAAFVPESDADRAVALMREDPAGAGACRIGRVTPKPQGLVTMTSEIGATRIVDMLSGEQLPRIC
jgi:hydrogenase expression/formation protein HypE